MRNGYFLFKINKIERFLSYTTGDKKRFNKIDELINTGKINQVTSKDGLFLYNNYREYWNKLIQRAAKEIRELL